jgi:type I restriction enzyme M protein
LSEETVPPGKIKCFITGKLRNSTPEELVRQVVARSLVEEYGYQKRDIDMEFTLKMGTAKKRADIVVFLENKKHEQENAYIIIETKKEEVKPSDKKEGLSQLESYVAASPNCSFALWVGNERLSFNVVKEDGRRVTKQIPDIPRNGESSIPKPTRGSLVPAVNLKQVFRRTHNYIYVNQGFQKDKAFEELQKLIFIKVYDEQYSPALQFYMLPGEPISNVRVRLLSVFEKVRNRYKYIFRPNESLELNDDVLGYVVSELQRFSLVDTETDVKGEAYEEIVGPNLRGDRGEFFTPRNVCRMTIRMVFSLFTEGELTSPGSMKILDPAVGTGGFLIAGIQELKQLFSKRGAKHDQLRDLVRDVANSNYYGIDFNPFLVKVAQMNMVMHGDGSSNIEHVNSLEKPEKWDEETRKNIKLGEFDIVVTNPPFGTKAVIDNPEILDQYELKTLGGETQRTVLPPEQLFIERCLAFLKPNGLLGIVLPNSILTNPGLLWVREWLLRRAVVIASIDLPVETFQPHTGTQTSVLILRKRNEKMEDSSLNYTTFMAIPEKVGHDRRGNPIFVTAPDGTIELDSNGLSLIDDDLPGVADAFREWVIKKGMI